MKSYDGCWTCRLRKKRCDETRPTCKNCSALQITCHFGEKKPSWMDNGLRQREKAKEFKREVHNAAVRRRGILPMDDTERSTAEPNGNAELNVGRHHRRRTSTRNAHLRNGSFMDHSPRCTSTPARASTETESSDLHLHSWNQMVDITGNFSPDGILGESELDLRFMMFYFDHFFPFLFPFYKPSLLEGGRSWIIELVAGNEAIRHTTLCLSAYFVSTTLDGAVSGPNVCKTLAWDRLLEQMGVTFAMLQRSLREVASESIRDNKVKLSRIMGSIIQLQRFEIAVGNFENSRKHLDAAIALFALIFRADDSGVPTLPDVLCLMGRPLWAIKSQHTGAWSSDQAAFRFYSALLIVDDIVASTCIGEAPRLLEYHDRLLASSGSHDERSSLNLEEFMGCETWVMSQISEISTLDAWKKSKKKDGQLDMMELVARASAIKQTLLDNLARVDARAKTPKANQFTLFAFHNDPLPFMSGGSSAFVTRVWAHATLLYLSLVVSGWQPRSVDIRQNVAQILTLLEQMSAPDLLRTMVWPFCVAGCLAEPAEECRFQTMADALVPHRLFGASRRALKIMKSVWAQRDELTVDTDFATYVCSLGHVSLLV